LYASECVARVVAKHTRAVPMKTVPSSSVRVVCDKNVPDVIDSLMLIVNAPVQSGSVPLCWLWRE
jgi:hypothetical protein